MPSTPRRSSVGNPDAQHTSIPPINPTRVPHAHPRRANNNVPPIPDAPSTPIHIISTRHQPPITIPITSPPSFYSSFLFSIPLSLFSALSLPTLSSLLLLPPTSLQPSPLSSSSLTFSLLYRPSWSHHLCNRLPHPPFRSLALAAKFTRRVKR